MGTALLFIGLGALPSMAFTGRAVDRFGLRVAAWLLVALAGAGLLITAGADGVVLLVIGMLVVGAASGAADVAINTLAGRAEHATAKPLLTRSHGLFSVGVVIASLSTGALLGVGLSLLAAFAVVAVVMLALAVAAHLTSKSLQIPAHQGDAGTGRKPAKLPVRSEGRRQALAWPRPVAHEGTRACCAGSARLHPCSSWDWWLRWPTPSRTPTRVGAR
ncbi:MFS transporter [Micromonospora sp. NPDC000442]|uniref:MFS transporter n=1 Tax=Micromonospora sp. NPDC000442 TaxID=3364217 RepID=UPI00368410BA